MTINLTLVVGTRPQIIKSIPFINLASNDKEVDLSIIHTGQHYDYEMTTAIFKEFMLPQPTSTLEVGSHPPLEQIARMMSSLHKVLDGNIDFMIVPGDTNSALAAALAASKKGIPLAHMEAGARSYNMRGAEEVNRRLIDHCSDLLFAPTRNCRKNLVDERVRGKVCFSGDTMLDIFYATKEKVDECNIVEDLGLKRSGYYLLTLHRAENVDTPKQLTLRLNEMRLDETVIFPIHPRTRDRIEEFGINLPPNIHPIKPVSYIEMTKLVKHSKGVATDSGGLQKEAFWAGKLMAVLRDKHEWPETITGRITNFGYGDASRTIFGMIKNIVRPWS